MADLFLSKEVFPADAIKTARKAFSSLCDISVAQNSNYTICSFYNCKFDAEITKREFENYLIDFLNSVHQ